MSSLPETLVQFRTDLEQAIGREQAERVRTSRRRQRSVALAAAVLVMIVGTASAFGTVRDFIFGSGGSAFSSPAWSPDGLRIAFLHHRWDDRDFSTEVYVMNADGSGQRNVTDQWGRRAVDIRPIWSPDWRRIAFVPYACTAVKGKCVRTAHIYVMNVDGSRLHRIARAGTHRAINGQRVDPRAPGPVWSPDGRKLAFSSERDGNAELYVMNSDGSNQRRLTRSPEAEESLTWSPDGRKIAFVRSIRGRSVTIAGVTHPGRLLRQEIYVMNADGSGQRMLARGHAPAWSRDGRKIAFRSDRDGNGEIYVMNADGSGLTRLTRNPASDGGAFWSHDGRRIFFVRSKHGNSDIYVINADASEERSLTPDARPARRAYDGTPVLSPDGRRIAFVSELDGNGQIYVMNADGSGKRRLTRNS